METNIELNRHELARVHLISLAREETLDVHTIAPKPGTRFDRPLVSGSPGMTPPRILHEQPPVYPRELSERGLEGKVVLSFVVGGTGEVSDIHLLTSPNDVAAESALKALRAYIFDPATVNGQPVSSRISLEINFRIR